MHIAVQWHQSAMSQDQVLQIVHQNKHEHTRRLHVNGHISQENLFIVQRTPTRGVKQNVMVVISCDLMQIL